MRALVVIPTYDEAENIETILRRVLDSDPALEVLVVDDASPDGTARLAEKVGLDTERVHVIERPAKLGLASAYRDGFAWGLRRGAPVLVQLDADGSHDPARLRALISAVEHGADLAIGSRYVPGGRIVGWSWRRRWLSRWGSRYAAGALGLAINDATSGYRAYRAGALGGLEMETLRAGGYGFQIEMTHRLVRRGGSIVEIPITFTDRARGSSKLSGGIVREALSLVTRLALRDLVRRDRYRRPS